MNPNLQNLQSYPFEKLAQLKSGITPPQKQEHIALSIGEPKHKPPEFVLNTLQDNLHTLSNYPSTKGLPQLRQAIASWAEKRFNLTINSLNSEENILPVNGTREALFAFTQAVIDNTKDAHVIMPNPFYQIYEGAALISGAKPVFVNCSENTNFLPDFDAIDDTVWDKCQLLFICTPGNPTGALLSSQQLQKLISLADKHDFIIASDECYSELYFDETHPPTGLLQACADIGRHSYERCIVFHSLSKRSNLPGLRSGFVAGDKKIIQQFLLYRTYHGCAMPIYTQLASIAAWQDEQHVKANRELYRQKFAAVMDILSPHFNISMPQASFYLWPETPITDTDFAQQLFAQQNVTVLPGSFLARDTKTGNPGENRIRLALVAPLNECIQAAERIKHFTSQLKAK